MRALAFATTSLLALASASTLAHAGESNEVGYLGFARAMRAGSADAITGDMLAGVSLEYGRALDLGVGDRIQIWLDAQADFGTASGTMFGTMDTKLASATLLGGVRVRYLPLSLVAVGIRVDVGAHHESLDLDAGSTALSDGAWGAAAMAAASLDVYAYRSKRFAIGLRFEVAYTKTQAVELTMHRDGGDDGTIKLPVMDTSFGHLDTSGPSFVGGLIGQF